MFLFVSNKDIYARQQTARSELERFLDKCANHTRVGIFNDDMDGFFGNYVLELNGVLYILKKNVQANTELIKRNSDREVIVKGKVNSMKYKGDGKVYL